MFEAKLADYFVDLTASSSPSWTTLGPMAEKTLQKSAKQKIIEIAANPINSEERDSAVKGIDKRILENGVIILKDTKNGEIRSMSLVGLPLELLKAHLLSIRTHLLFPSTINADRPLDIRSAFHTALKKAAIANFTFHDLRHTTGSYLAMGGHSLLDISTLLGHKSLQMTKRYAHLSQEYKKKLVSTMAEKMFENADEFKKGT